MSYLPYDRSLFYGSDGLLIERTLTNVSRGNATYLAYTVDGAKHAAVFGSPLGPRESTLTVGSSTFPIEVEMGATSVPAGTQFKCK